MVNIREFCKRCKYADTKANESPCKECMERGIFKGNAMPLCYENSEKVNGRKGKKSLDFSRQK